MIYECTDCKHCASFSSGFRVVCLSEDETPDAVHNFQSLGQLCASDCLSFDEVWPEFEFSMKDFDEAQAYSQKKYGEVTYPGIKEWCKNKLDV